MAHAIIITCDACGHEERYSHAYKTAQQAVDNLIHGCDWQTVAYTRADTDSRGQRPYTQSELRCPDCALTPIAERKAEHNETAAD